MIKDKEETKLEEKQELLNEAPEAKALGIDVQEVTTQVQHEYDLAWKHQSPKKEEARVRLKLFNNQKRDKEAVGDTTMFSIFQTILASLYDDRLKAGFTGKEEGDDETADNLEAMAKSDYEEMEKDQLDYEWIWNTCFFGRALMLNEQFEREPDKNIFYPLPENIDPITWLRDPAATCVNGNRHGKGAMRFGGNEIKMTKDEMQKHPSFFSDIKFEDLKYGSGTYSLLQDAIDARNTASGNQDVNKDKEQDLGVNAEYTITQWFTHAEVGEKIVKVKLWFANDRSILVGAKLLKRNYWPIIDRALYPHSNDWDGTSIPDLTEDKQRARAIALNLGLKAMKADLYPMYIYDTNRIKNKADLDFDYNKFIGVDAQPGESVGNSLIPLNKARPNMQLTDWIMDTLDVSAQKATGTPDIKMGIQSQSDRPLGETNLLSSAADTRSSLAAKIFGWSEKRFWQQWYNLYKDNFEENIDEKMLRIVGSFGAKWRPLKRQDIISRLDPDIVIESTNVSRAKEMEDRIALTPFYTNALNEPSVNRRFLWKDWAKLNGMGKDKIDRLFPPTVDERIAEKQNELLNEDKTAPVLPEDDHMVHLEIHAMAKDTDAAKAHIETHIKALSIKKTNPEMFPAETETTDMNQDQGKGGMANVLPGLDKVARPIAPSQTSNQR